MQALDQVCAWQHSIYRIEANEPHLNPIKYWSIWVLHHCLWSLCFLCIFWSQKHGLLAGLCVCLATCYMQGQGRQNGCTFGLNKEGNFTGTWGLSGTGSCLCLARCHMQNRRKIQLNPHQIPRTYRDKPCHSDPLRYIWVFQGCFSY